MTSGHALAAQPPTAELLSRRALMPDLGCTGPRHRALPPGSPPHTSGKPAPLGSRLCNGLGAATVTEWLAQLIANEP